jgi:hypothetical protein
MPETADCILELHMPGSEAEHLAQRLLLQWVFLAPNTTACEGEEPGYEP